MMKKDNRSSLLILACLIAGTIFCTACGSGSISAGSAETGRPETEASAAERNTEAVATPPETQDDLSSASEPEIMQPACETFVWHIDELDLDLEIPENWYGYQIDGIYLDWTGELNSHSFSKWFLVCDREYDEQMLSDRLAEDPSETAKHVVFGFSLTSAEMMPARRLCYGLFGSDSVRKTDDGYCEIFIPGSIAAAEIRPGAYVTVESETRGSEARTFAAAWTDQLKRITVPTVHLWDSGDMVLCPDSVSEAPYQDTMVNEVWWEHYSSAVSELEQSVSQYPYDAEAAEGLIGEVSALAERYNEQNWVYGTEKLASVNADIAENIWLWAYCYANYRTDHPESEISLRDIIVILQNWENGQRSFLAFCKNENGGTPEYVRIGGGYDYLVDLQASYDYVRRCAGQ